MILQEIQEGGGRSHFVLKLGDPKKTSAIHLDIVCQACILLCTQMWTLCQLVQIDINGFL